MWSISHLVFLLIIFSAINSNFSAVHFNTRPSENRLMEYSLHKRTSTYRGLLFTLSATRKNELCEEVFSVQLYADGGLENPEKSFAMKSLINDGLDTNGDPQYPLIVRQLDRTYGGIPYPSHVMDVFFRCVGKSFVEREPFPEHTDYHISFAFRSGWFYANALSYNKKDEAIYMYQLNLFMKSPEYVDLNPNQLEDQFVSIRRTMRSLEKESPRYVAMIDRRSDLQQLSKFMRDLLCASFLTSPVYRKDRLEFSLDRYEKDDGTLRCEKRELKFRNDIYNMEDFDADCFICHAYANQDNRINPQNLFSTPTYRNNHSFYVLKEEAEGIFLSKHFTHAPVLKNARAYTKKPFIYKNYDPFNKIKKKNNLRR